MFQQDAKLDLKVAKFGGTSLANAAQFRKVAEIIQAEPERKYVVASAPGKRSGDDIKVTDLLIACTEKKERAEAEEILSKLQSRYKVMVRSLGVKLDVDEEFGKISEVMMNPEMRDYVISRGEYLNARILAEFLGWEFVDAEGHIFLDEAGQYDEEKTRTVLGAKLASCEGAVIPGFYGTMPDGTIRAFSRGGSDITGAIVAAVYNHVSDFGKFGSNELLKLNFSDLPAKYTLKRWRIDEVFSNAFTAWSRMGNPAQPTVWEREVINRRARLEQPCADEQGAASWQGDVLMTPNSVEVFEFIPA
jgi:hypothetical protein